MMFDHDDLMIKKSLNTIQTPEYNIKQEVQKEMEKSSSYISLKRAVPITFVALIMLVFSVGVSAAYSPSFNSLLSIISPEIALKLQPIESSSEDEGIKMEVVAAMSDEEMAIIYITMQDLTGNRIDETLDLYDDYSLTGARIFNSQIVDYDETTKTATLRIQANGGGNLNGKKLNFRVNSFLSNKQIFEEVTVNANLIEIKNNTPQTMKLDRDHSAGSGGELVKELVEQGEIRVLKPGEAGISLPGIPAMHISTIGFIDNRLHIQTKWREDNIDDHGYFYFVDYLGNKVHSSSVNFGMDDSGHTKYGHEMIEYIFDMDDIDLNKSELRGYFVTNGSYTTGNWNTTFKIQSVEEEMEMDFTKDFGTWIANSITVSPLGVTLYGTGENSDSNNPSVSAKMKDGSIQALDSVVSHGENKKVKLKFIPLLPLDIEKVQSIIVDGTEIDVQ